MYIVNWNRPIMQAMMNRLMNEGNKSNCGCCAPATNIIDSGELIEIEMAVPGRKKEDFDIKVEKNILTVSYENGKDEGQNYRLHEFGKGSFCRSFALSDEIKVDDIKANYENGILNLALPRREEVVLKRAITIS